MEFRVEDHTKEAIDAKNEAVDRALEIIGGKLERYAKQTLTETKAVDTGLLRNSVTYVVSGKNISKSYHATKGSTGQGAGSKGAGQVRTGRYLGTMGTDKEQAVYVGTNVEYAPYIELGTSKMKPRPYLKTAVQNHVNEYKNILKKELDQG